MIATPVGCDGASCYSSLEYRNLVKCRVEAIATARSRQLGNGDMRTALELLIERDFWQPKAMRDTSVECYGSGSRVVMSVFKRPANI